MFGSAVAKNPELGQTGLTRFQYPELGKGFYAFQQNIGSVRDALLPVGLLGCLVGTAHDLEVGSAICIAQDQPLVVAVVNLVLVSADPWGKLSGCLVGIIGGYEVVI